MRQQRSMGVGLGLALLSAITFSTSGTFARSLIEAGWSAEAAVATRVGVASLLLALPAALSLRGRWNVLRRNLGILAVFGLLAVAGAQACFFNAVRYLPVGVALLLEYLGIILVVGWMWVVHGQRPRRLTVAGSVAALLGLVFVLDLAGGGRLDPIGVLWGLAAGVGLAAYFVLSAGGDGDLPATAMASGGLARPDRRAVRGRRRHPVRRRHRCGPDPGGKARVVRWSERGHVRGRGRVAGTGRVADRRTAARRCPDRRRRRAGPRRRPVVAAARAATGGSSARAGSGRGSGVSPAGLARCHRPPSPHAMTASVRRPAQDRADGGVPGVLLTVLERVSVRMADRVRVMRTAWAACGKPSPRGGVDGDSREGAGLRAAVTPLLGAVPEADLRPRQGLELLEQGGLVRLHRDHQVRTPGGDLVGVADLGG